MMRQDVVVAGLGNIFHGDDAFGVAVIYELERHELPRNVRLMDTGIRALDLTYTLLDGWELVILVDAASRGHAPGTLFVLDLDALVELPNSSLDAHSLRPEHVVGSARALGARLKHVRLVGCEPRSFLAQPGPELWSLSGHVSASVKPAAELVKRLIAEKSMEVPCTS